MRGDIQTEIFAHLLKNTGKQITLDDLVVATNYDRRQIQNCLATSRREGKWPIVPIIGGRVWYIGRTRDSVAVNEADEPTQPELTAVPGDPANNPVLPKTRFYTPDFRDRLDRDHTTLGEHDEKADERLLARNRAPQLNPAHRPAPVPAENRAQPTNTPDADHMDRVYEW